MSEVIRQRRAALGMSQGDLARAVGVDTRQIRRYEAGEQQPLLSVAVAIAEALHVSLTELIQKTDPYGGNADGQVATVISEESRSVLLVTFVGTDEASLLRGAATWLSERPAAALVGLNWNADWLAPSEADVEEMRQRLDLTVEIMGE